MTMAVNIEPDSEWLAPGCPIPAKVVEVGPDMAWLRLRLGANFHEYQEAFEIAEAGDWFVHSATDFFEIDRKRGYQYLLLTKDNLN